MDGEEKLSQKNKKKTLKIKENNADIEINEDLKAEKGFLWGEIIESKNSVIAAKDALITELNRNIKLLEEKVDFLNEKLHAKQDHNLGSKSYCETAKISGRNETSVKVAEKNW